MKYATILAILSITSALQFDKDGKTSLSKEQISKLEAEHKNKFGVELKIAALEYDDDGYTMLHENELASIEAALSKEAVNKPKPTGEAPEGISAVEFAQMQRDITALSKKNKELESQINLLSNSSEAVEAVIIETSSTKPKKPELMSWDKIDASRPWNMLAAAQANGADLNNVEAIIGASSTDYSKLNEDLGNYYRTRFKDEINTFVKEYSDLRKLFPVRSNVQDEQIVTNMFVGEFSQAFQDTFTSKGEYVFQPEKVKMFDVKFDHKFTKMKEMEKTWLGYLNTSGSNALKLPFVKFLLQETLKKLFNEQQNRLINGVYIAPTEGVAGYAINAANGLRKLIRTKIAERKIKTFGLGEINATNVEDIINAGAMLIPEHLRNSGDLICYVSSDILYMYFRRLNTLYGSNVDYKAGETKLKFNDNIHLEVIPGMGNSQRIIFTHKGNIMICEDKPNEMAMLQFEQEDRSLKTWSDWKEAMHIDMVGKQWDNIQDADYEHQMIWVNDIDLPSSQFIAMAADDTTPSVENHTSLISVANTVATAITDIDDMVVGQTMILKCGSNTNAISIAKAGNFSKISAAWTPNSGDTITLYKRGANDIIDLARTAATTDAILIDADDTTPSVASGNKFMTSANTVATAITNLDDAVIGQTYTIHGGSNTNSSSIANSGNFALTAAMNLILGSYIKLYCRGANDFIELERG